MLKTILEQNFPAQLKFCPKKEFYQHVGINPKRFWMMVDGKIKPNMDELRAVCLFFNVDIAKYL